MEYKTAAEWLKIINELHIKLCTEEYTDCIETISECGKYHQIRPKPDNVGHRNREMAKFLEEILSKAKSIYYTTETTIMDDAVYDKYESWLKTLKPDSDVLSQVGYKKA